MGLWAGRAGVQLVDGQASAVKETSSLCQPVSCPWVISLPSQCLYHEPAGPSPANATSSGCALKAATYASRQPGCGSTSSSQNTA